SLFDILRHHSLAAFHPVGAANHRHVHQHATRDDAILRHLNRFDGRPQTGGDQVCRSAVVHLAFPEEVRQAIQVGDGVAVEDHAEKIDGALIAAVAHLLATGPALTAFHHIVDGRSRGVRPGVIANGARTNDPHALTYP